jgi:hypothetical protein
VTVHAGNLGQPPARNPNPQLKKKLSEPARHPEYLPLTFTDSLIARPATKERRQQLLCSAAWNSSNALVGRWAELPDRNGVADPQLQQHDWEIPEKTQISQDQQQHEHVYECPC